MQGKVWVSLHQYSMSLWTTTASLTEILKFKRTPDHLASHRLCFKLRESHQLKLLSLLVLVNVDGFTRCHKEWQSIAQGMHHVAHQSTMGETDEDLVHDTHLDLQEQMRNPIAFHAKMMGDII
jgi:hypothetical protein